MGRVKAASLSYSQLRRKPPKASDVMCAGGMFCSLLGFGWSDKRALRMQAVHASSDWLQGLLLKGRTVLLLGA